jgi:type IV pilus assembly protein PilB
MLNALSQQGQTHEKLGQILVHSKFLTSEELDLFLQMQAIPIPAEFTDEYTDPNLLQKLNPEFCLQRKVLPLQVFQGTNRSFLALAMSNPQDVGTVEIVGRKAEMHVVPIYSDEISINEFLKKYVPPGGARIMEQESLDSQTLIRRLIMDAIRRHASDVHIEPDRNDLNVRYRIDGVLYKIKSPKKEDHVSLIASLKKLAKMDVQNTRIPQTNKIMLRLGEQRYQLNILSFPNPHGESISIKIVSLSTFLRNLDEVGFTDDQLAKIKVALDARFGLILLSGPLMNGVSTTEYSMMRYLASSQRKIMTLESPIFATIRHVHQSEINPSTGFDFITGLNSIIRSNPDVIFVSDIPNAEVAATICKIAARCIVIAWLNSISAANTIVLLQELGASPSLASQALSLVVNQRLIRKICQHCSAKSPISEALLTRMGLTSQEAQGLNAYAGIGCKECNFIGFNGRIAIFEVLPISPAIANVIATTPIASEIEKAAIKEGMLSLRSRCLQRINEGITTIEEFQKSKF